MAEKESHQPASLMGQDLETCLLFVDQIQRAFACEKKFGASTHVWPGSVHHCQKGLRAKPESLRFSRDLDQSRIKTLKRIEVSAMHESVNGLIVINVLIVVRLML